MKPSELRNDPRRRKTRMMGLSDSERISMIRSAVLIQYTRVTDGQTDGRNWRGIYASAIAYMQWRVKIMCCVRGVGIWGGGSRREKNWGNSAMVVGGKDALYRPRSTSVINRTESPYLHARANDGNHNRTSLNEFTVHSGFSWYVCIRLMGITSNVS